MWHYTAITTPTSTPTPTPTPTHHHFPSLHLVSLQVKIGMDVAAAEFLTKDGSYDLDFKNPKNDGSMKLSGEKMLELYADLVAKYPIISIEDPFDQG
jgi:enolase